MGQFKLQEDGFSVAVIGAGTMGAGIAQVAAQALFWSTHLWTHWIGQKPPTSTSFQAL
jgi:hypothetical protein